MRQLTFSNGGICNGGMLRGRGSSPSSLSGTGLDHSRLVTLSGHFLSCHDCMYKINRKLMTGSVLLTLRLMAPRRVSTARITCGGLRFELGKLRTGHDWWRSAAMLGYGKSIDL